MIKNDMKRVEEIERKPIFTVGKQAIDDKDVAFLIRTIKQQQKRIESYGGALQDISDCNHIRDIYEAVNRADQALEELK
ncbi:hypothetical protein [Salimicrobium album]|uniref:Uncharacterized protein n=1 Tax=Salimicrobium album TaxID=50717 RepID=A0A1H3D5V4_9BACI|nr:hypothetical protein [Salimicrobium album]SDX61882.1 hypothetical protein SAMN04488081_0845 [Salimicrobium album]